MVNFDKLKTSYYGTKSLLCLSNLFFVTTENALGLTLDEAVAQQLATINGLPCAALIESNPANIDAVLVGSLKTICARNANQGESPGSSALGGGAATPASLPKIIRRRLEDSDHKDKESVGGASGDSVVELGRGISLFLSGEFQKLDRVVTKFEDGYDSDIWRVIAGGDYQIPELMTAGIAFDYRSHNGNFTSNAGTGFQQDSYGFLAFGSLTPVENLFLQLTAGYAAQQNQRSRFASFIEQATDFSRSGINDSNYAGQEYSASVLAGYDLNFGNLNIGPRLGMDWVRNEYDIYTEKGSSGLELRYANDHRTSLQTRTGVFGSMNFSTGIGVIVPQLGVDWVHEFANNQRDITVSFVGDTRGKQFTFQNERPDRDFLEINAGTSLVLPHGIQTFVSYRGIAGHSYYDGHGVNAGLRMEF